MTIFKFAVQNRIYLKIQRSWHFQQELRNVSFMLNKHDILKLLFLNLKAN